MKSGVKRPFFYAQHFVRYALDVERDTPPVHRTLLQTFQNQQRQRSLQILALRSSHSRTPLDFYRRMHAFDFDVKFQAKKPAKTRNPLTGTSQFPIGAQSRRGDPTAHSKCGNREYTSVLWA